MTPIKKDATVRPTICAHELPFSVCSACCYDYVTTQAARIAELEIQLADADRASLELEEARNKHWRGEEIAVRQLEIVKAQAEALSNALIKLRELGCDSEIIERALNAFRTANPDSLNKEKGDA